MGYTAALQGKLHRNLITLLDWGKVVRAFGLVVGFAVLATGLFWPLSYVVSKGITLTGFYEESVGYRYFYTLRQMYEGNPYVFLPQGQLVDLWHQLLQLLLTWKGFPPNSLFPRIDLFTYYSVGTAHMVSLTAYLWVFARVREPWAPSIAGLFLIATLYNRGISGYFTILQPDYHIWVIPIAIVFIGTVGIWTETAGAKVRLSEAASLAALVGLSLSIKPTFGIFGASLGVAWIIARPNRFRSAVLMTGAALAAHAVVLAVLIRHYRGNWEHLRTFFRDQAVFLSSSGQTHAPYWSWVGERLTDPWLISFPVAFPFVCIAALCFTRDIRWIGLLFGLGAGSLAYQALLYVRFTSATQMEAAIYFLAGVFVLLRQAASRFPLGKTALFAVAALLVFGILDGVSVTHREFLPLLGRTSHGTRQLHVLLTSRTKLAALLIRDNSERPLTVHSAILKGGRDISWRESPSPLMKQIFPHQFFTGPSTLYRAEPLSLERFNRIVIALNIGEDEEEAIRGLEQFYAASLLPFELIRRLDAGSQYIHVLDRRSNLNLQRRAGPIRFGSNLALNANSTFSDSTSADPLAGFFISPDTRGLGYKVVLRDGPDGPAVRIEALRILPYLVINDLFYGKVLPSDALAVRATVRGQCHGSFKLTIFDVTGNEGKSEAVTTTGRCSLAWITLRAEKSSTKLEHRSDNYSVGLWDVQPGDWFEVRELSLFKIPKSKAGAH